jgi:hypothetical protein
VTNKSKDKGTRAESDFVKYCNQVQGLPYVERRALSGTNDRGDIAGMVGVVIEIKAALKLEIPAWKRETLKERENDQADICALVVKIPRKAVAQWDAHVPLWLLSVNTQGSSNGYSFYHHRQVWVRMTVEDLFHVLRGEGYVQ